MCSTPKGSITLKAPSFIPERMSNDASFTSSFKASNDNVERLQTERLNAFNQAEPNFDQIISVNQIRCPSHLIQFLQALKTLSTQQTLKVSSRSKALIEDLSASSRILNYPCSNLQLRHQHFLYVTKID